MTKSERRMGSIFLMGLDGLDLIFRLEKAFNIRVQRWDGARLLAPAEVFSLSLEDFKRTKATTTTVTVGQIYFRVCELLKRDGHPIPVDSWKRVQRCVSECLGIPIEEVVPEARFVQDLGAT